MAQIKRTTAPDGIPRSVIDGLPVTVEAILGAAEVTVGELNALRPGETLALDARLADHVALRLNGVTIAAGELVAVGDRFAVRIAATSET
jgi:flagellar motor switch protein FliN/FliY